MEIFLEPNPFPAMGLIATLRKVVAEPVQSNLNENNRRIKKIHRRSITLAFGFDIGYHHLFVTTGNPSNVNYSYRVTYVQV